tara:strand:+ start:912 stop:1172 length:261 start_codon:yes stop_codon:yes gene_type:complete
MDSFDDTHIIQQSATGVKVGTAAAFTGALGTWVLDHSVIISLTILFAGFVTGVFFSWRKDKYLKRECERREIEHELRMNRRMTDNK